MTIFFHRRKKKSSPEVFSFQGITAPCIIKIKSRIKLKDYDIFKKDYYESERLKITLVNPNAKYSEFLHMLLADAFRGSLIRIVCGGCNHVKAMTFVAYQVNGDKFEKLLAPPSLCAQADYSFEFFINYMTELRMDIDAGEEITLMLFPAARIPQYAPRHQFYNPYAHPRT